MKFGTLFAYWTHEWTGDYKYYARKVASLGFDALEISAGELVSMTDAEVDELRAVTKSEGIIITSNIGPAKEMDVSSADPAVRANGIKFLTEIMKKMDRLDSRSLIGVLYGFWPCDFIDQDKEAIWARGVESVKTLCDTADSLGINYCLEVLNRFESLVMNTAEEGVRFCQQVDKPRVKLLLDTFHMNIEEDSFTEAFHTAGDYLGHVHVGECNRRVPGKGRMPWAEIGAALHDVGYDGNVIMEPFVTMGGKVASDIKVWRDLSEGADEAQLDAEIAQSLKFLRGVFLA